MQAMAIISFTYSCSQETLSELAMDFATNVKPSVKGLIWKIYLNDPEQRRSAGIYLFRDLHSANAYVSGPHVQDLRRATIVSDLSARVYETMREPSILSGGLSL